MANIVIFFLLCFFFPKGYDNSEQCLSCEKVVSQIQNKIEQDVDSDDLYDLEEISTLVCLLKSDRWSSSPVDENVCRGLVQEFTLEIISILLRSKLLPRSICGFIGHCPKSNDTKDWNVTFPNTTKPPIMGPPKILPASPKYRILHLSDIHYDPLYMPNRTTDCGEPVCCRHGNAKDFSSNASGKWGDYRYCDTTLWTFENMLRYLAENFPNIDYVIYTGDTTSHVVWETSPEKNLLVANVTYQLIRKYLPNAKFFGAIGNHDPSPVNLVPPPEVDVGFPSNSIQWMYDGLADIWKLDSSQKTFRYAGFYAQRLDEDLVLISLHMNFGDSNNWWLLVDSEDPGGMLQWLVDTLQECEDANERVIIIAHQHPNGLLDPFNRNYFDIILRYENTVRAQFYGHTHEDTFLVFLDPSNPSRAFNYGLMPGSVTPYSHLNYGFRILEMDIRTKYLLNYENYIFNLTEANQIRSPSWYMEYSARKTYLSEKDYTQPMTAQDWANVTIEMQTDDVMWNDFLFYRIKSTNDPPICEDSCRSDTICSLRTAWNGHRNLFCL